MRVTNKDMAVEGDLSYLKLIAEALSEFAVKRGIDLPNKVSDLCFNVNCEYQQFHELDEDDWGMTRADLEEYGLDN